MAVSPEVIFAVSVGHQPPVRVIPRDQTPEEKLRRVAISMMRTLAREWPKEYAAINRELVPQDLR